VRTFKIRLKIQRVTAYNIWTNANNPGKLYLQYLDVPRSWRDNVGTNFGGFPQQTLGGQKTSEIFGAIFDSFGL